MSDSAGKFKVGDRVRRAAGTKGMAAAVGHTATVGEKGVYWCDICRAHLVDLKWDDGEGRNYQCHGGYYPADLELVPVAEATGTFKVGDRVTCVSSDKCSGKSGTIIEDDRSPVPFRVRFEDWSDGHGYNDSEWWLMAEDLVAASSSTLRIEAGKFYRTRDGRKVGPMVRIDDGEFVWESPDCYCGEDGRAVHLDKSNDLIAECIDEPAVAHATAKFKVGDRVVARGYSRREGDCFGTVDRINEVVSQAHASDWSVGVREGWLAFDQLELVTTPSTSAIVALIENGQPKPSHRPYVHASREAAETEASRLAGKHPGKEFGVYELVASRKEAKVYDFEWQRLAASGLKIEAIKSLRGITGLISLRSAKTAVEDFVEREAA